MELSFWENSSVSYAAFLPTVLHIYLLTHSPSLSGTVELIFLRTFQILLPAPRQTSCSIQTLSFAVFSSLRRTLIPSQEWKKHIKYKYQTNIRTSKQKTVNKRFINFKISCIWSWEKFIFLKEPFSDAYYKHLCSFCHQTSLL